MTVEIRRPLFSGSQLVRALWFDAAQHGEDVARQRLLHHWQPGARAYRIGEGYLLEWAQARRLVCEKADGLPLCEQHGLLMSAPMLAQERAGLPPGHAVLVRGALVTTYELTPATRIDPSYWLDLSTVVLREPLAMPVRRTSTFTPALPEAPADVRALLGDAVPPPSAQRAQFLQRAGRPPERSAADAALKLLGLAALGTAALTAGGLGWIGAISLRLFGSGGGKAGRGQAAADGVRKPRHNAPSPLRNWLSKRIESLANMTRLSAALGWRQAQYLRKMAEQFERGDLAEALRHAIPLDSPTSSGRRAFGLPERRDSLQITGARSAADIGMDPGSTNYLRSVYRRSFEALDRAGRIDEAVFVLAELLNCGAEAADYLERKGRLAQAAQLAETLELAPALQVRLHFLAGNVERAVLLARLYGCFPDVLAELDRRRHAAAPRLRVQWAEELAARGQLTEAAMAIWPLKEELQRALAWLQLARQAGGNVGVQALIFQLALDPGAVMDCSDAVQSLLLETDAEAMQLRVRAATCLSALDTHTPATRRLAAELWRVLVAERMSGGNAMTREDLSKLMDVAADPVLNADQPSERLPDAPRTQEVAKRTEALIVTLPERGLHALKDVRRLPSGDYLLALGDAGMLQIRRDGRQVARFPVPTHHLVVSDSGQRVLALAQREKVTRVSRIDLLTRKVTDWFSARLDYWSPRFEGGSWNVVANERLMALDAMAPGQSVLWQIGDLPGRIAGFTERDGMQALLLESGKDHVEQWRYVLPQRRLLQRDPIEMDQDAAYVLLDTSRNRPHQLALVKISETELSLRLLLENTAGRRSVELATVTARPQIFACNGMFALCETRGEAWCCKLISAEGRVLIDIKLPNAQQAAVAMHDAHLLAWDACGRLVDIDLSTSAVHTLTLG